MKTLAQVEPRVDVASLPGSDTARHVISSPGSYYLSGNIAADTRAAIMIAASDVTLDLNGFAIIGSGATGGDGVTLSGSQRNLAVRDGTIRGCRIAINHQDASASRYERLRLSNNVTGIQAGEECLVSDCIARENSAFGFFVGANAVIENSKAVQNGAHGIRAGDRSVLTRNDVRGNNDDGIRALNSCVVRDCTSTENRSAGISAGERALVSGCTAARNGISGIEARGDSVVIGNRSNSNGLQLAFGAGIQLFGSGSRVEGNHTRDNVGFGIRTSTGDVVIRNTAGANGTNYEPASGPNFGPLQNAATATSPTANHQY